MHRYFNGGRMDFAHESDATRGAELIAQEYSDQGVFFYASATQTTGTYPVYRYAKSVKHSYALSATDQKTLEDAGWTRDGVSFYAKPTAVDASSMTQSAPVAIVPVVDGKFTMAAFPDTQQQAYSWAGAQYTNQMQDDVNRKDSMDIKFAFSVGDTVCSGGNKVVDTTSDSNQYPRMASAFHVLNDAQIPYTIATGNHDTAAVWRRIGLYAV